LEADKLLDEIIEPETGLPAKYLGLIRVEGDTIYYRPISHYTPQFLVITMGIEILMITRKRTKVEGYYLEEEINKRLGDLYGIISGEITRTS